MKIYCDMDGVLVDFEGSMMKYINDILDGALPSEKRGRAFFWALSQIKKEFGESWRLKNVDDLKNAPVRKLMIVLIMMNPGAVFAGMAPCDDYRQLWGYINSFTGEVNILSAPMNGYKTAPMTAAEGKGLWVTQYLTPQPANVFIVPRADTIESWNDAGGIGILHEPNNSKKTIDQLGSLLELL
jgi:hypothetical protein